MTVDSCKAGRGLELAVRGTRPGVTWAPGVGRAAEGVRLSGIDWGWSKALGFPEVSGAATVEPGTGGSAVDPAQDTVVVTGVTGTGAGSLNVTYTRHADLLNGLPRWVNGTAVIYWASGYWRVSLGGVDQFAATDWRAAMPWEVNGWEIAGDATGAPGMSPQDDGTSATHAPENAVDFEGVALGAGAVHALEVYCTAGSVAVQWATGMVVLASGQWLPLVLAGGPSAAFLGAELKVYGLAAGAAASVTVAGVAD